MDVSINLNSNLEIMKHTKKVKPIILFSQKVNVPQITIFYHKTFLYIEGEGADPNLSKSRKKNYYV